MSQGARRARQQRIKATEAAIKAFSRGLRRFVSKEVSALINEIKAGSDKGKEAAYILGRLEKALDDAGLTKEIKKLHEVYADELDFIQQEFKELSGSAKAKQSIYSDADVETVEALVKFDTAKVSAGVGRYVTDVRSAVMRSVLAGEDTDFSGLEEKLGSRMVANLETELNTQLSAFSRTITMSKAQELGFDLFEYLGPDDQITRPFCEHVLELNPAIYTLEEIQGMDNEQGLPVITYGGGYNCRHQWRPISYQDAIEEGWMPPPGYELPQEALEDAEFEDDGSGLIAKKVAHG